MNPQLEEAAIAAGLAATAQGADVARKVYARLEFVAALLRASLGTEEGSRLVWREGERIRIQALHHTVTIGRDAGCEVVLPSPRVSRRHVVIEVREGEFLLRDLGSANGTCVNGGVVPDSGRVLADGDVIDVAGVPVVFFRAQ